LIDKGGGQKDKLARRLNIEYDCAPASPVICFYSILLYNRAATTEQVQHQHNGCDNKQQVNQPAAYAADQAQ
jgi:hypothetical protein